ncbi:MAG: HlyD family efflux transporter periplasmic adaptor subunit [Deltaproteobacteria bacterium]|nr:HlyD family efflux transporter periplasmic adaptor subunit [Deltaproteobacteria bacterium]
MTVHNEYQADFEVPSSRGARLTLWVAMLGVTAMLIWAGFSEIDQVTSATGQVIASSRTQVVQTADGGVLRELRVKEGDLVRSGQLLATLEKTRVQAAVADSRAKVAALRITLARLNAEVFGKPLSFAPELHAYPEYIENQRNLFNKRKKSIDEDIAALQQVRSAVAEELRMNKLLEESRDVSRSDILRLQRQVAEIDAQITGKRNKFFQDSQAEMTKAQEDLKTQLETFNDRNQLLEQTNLFAPAAGVVKNIKVTTLGGVVRPGDVVLEILPTGKNLIVEAKVYPSNIAFVSVGREAKVKLDAYDSSIFGGFKGVVTYVSPDTLTEETPRGPMPYYRVHVTIGEKEFSGKAAQQVEVRAGMTAQVDVVDMKRTVLSYVVNPVTKMFSQAMRAR